MTHAPPASLTICALTSPVCGPETAASQFCAPMAMRPRAANAARAISVDGGQIKTSAAGGVASTAVAIASISPSWAEVPCIFQFPAIKRRMTVYLTGREQMNWHMPGGARSGGLQVCDAAQHGRLP